MRRFPRSRRHPHFDAEALAEGAAGRAYAHLPELGGRRRRVAGSPNDGRQVEAFQGYADHMGSEEFALGLERLEALAAGTPAAVMCAEAPWWRCHRRLVAGALLAGLEGPPHRPRRPLTEHALPPFAVAEGAALTRPAPQLRL